MPPNRKLSIRYFNALFLDEDVCLEYIFRKRYPGKVRTYTRLLGRKCWQNAKGDQIYPLKGTIFENSSTPLTKWFFAMYLFAMSKNGVSAKELQRQLEVTYKCAWRMGHRIRSLMENYEPVSGVVEVDEVYIGGRRRRRRRWGDKAVVVGVVERGGRVVARHVMGNGGQTVVAHVTNSVTPASTVYSDQYGAYRRLSRLGYEHAAVNHSAYEWARGDVHTNTIEGFWSWLKLPLRGTYRSVSKRHLQKYVNEATFRYRQSPERTFMELLARI
jgi:transposase